MGGGESVRIAWKNLRPAIEQKQFREDLSGAAGPWRARGPAGHERAGERRGLLPVFVERGLEPREGPVAPGEADAVDGQVVDQPHVERVLGVSAVAHARGWLLGGAQEGTERVHVFRQDGLVAEVAGHLGEAGEEFVHGQWRPNGPGAIFKFSRDMNLHDRQEIIARV